MKKAIMSIISIAAVAFATIIATSACVFWSYQPEEPACLRDK
jgi:cyclic lactone autoinducer peptide